MTLNVIIHDVFGYHSKLQFLKYPLKKINIFLLKVKIFLQIFFILFHCEMYAVLRMKDRRKIISLK